MPSFHPHTDLQFLSEAEPTNVLSNMQLALTVTGSEQSLSGHNMVCPFNYCTPHVSVIFYLCTFPRF